MESFGVNVVQHCCADTHWNVIASCDIHDIESHSGKCCGCNTCNCNCCNGACGENCSCNGNNQCNDNSEDTFEDLSHSHSHAKCCIVDYYRFSPTKRVNDLSNIFSFVNFAARIVTELLPVPEKFIASYYPSKLIVKDGREILSHLSILII